MATPTTTSTTLKEDPEVAAKIDQEYGEALPEPEPFISFNALKDRIRHHYEVASDYYYGLWYFSSSFPFFYLSPSLITSTSSQSQSHHMHLSRSCRPPQLQLLTKEKHKGRTHPPRLLPHPNRHQRTRSDPTHLPPPQAILSSQRQHRPRRRLRHRWNITLPRKRARLHRHRHHHFRTTSRDRQTSDPRSGRDSLYHQPGNLNTRNEWGVRPLPRARCRENGRLFRSEHR